MQTAPRRYLKPSSGFPLELHGADARPTVTDLLAVSKLMVLILAVSITTPEDRTKPITEEPLPLTEYGMPSLLQSFTTSASCPVFSGRVT